MDSVSEALARIPMPQMFQARQIFQRPQVAQEDIPGIITGQLQAEKFRSSIQPGMRIGITGSSRGIANQALILKTIVEFVKGCGADPFIVPAMGSHGESVAENQRHILAGYGIVEAYVGCPIRATMETTYIGDASDGRPVYIDKYAAEADGIIVCNRIKPHTSFRGPYESGLMKMMAIGLGKQHGADTCHQEGLQNMPISVPLFGRAILKHSPVLFGVGVLENAYDETAKITVLLPEEIDDKEPELLKEAFSMMPRIIVGSCDVLIVDQLGKNFSGTGMDPNITGYFHDPSLRPDFALEARRICVLDVSDESNGHCTGVGASDATTRRLFDKFNYVASYINAITSMAPEDVRIPAVMENDKLAVQFCIHTSFGVDRTDAKRMRIVRIPNTLHLEHIQLSEAYLGELSRYSGLTAESEPTPMAFDENGNLF